jgi:hypothetical protein
LSLPGANPFAGAEDSASSLRTLVRNEQEAARHLRHLARQDPELYEGYLTLLLETFARDREKHVHLLRYLLRLIESSRLLEQP